MSRPRPTYTPRKIVCRECGGGLDLRDERTVQRVCDYCGSVLQLTETEQRVLERRGQKPGGVAYRIALQERLTLDGVPYEVIARVCVIEDGDPAEQTHQYYLYHPRREPQWLSEYRGSWDVSQRTRVRPDGDPFDLGRSQIRTYDGQTWAHEEAYTLTVTHVDGALPYLQQVGDSLQVRAFHQVGQLALTYEASRTETEVEYAFGRSLSTAQVEAALGRPLAPRAGAGAAERPPTGRAKGFLVALALLSGGTLFALLALVLYDGRSGQRVLATVVSNEQLGRDNFSEPFSLTEDDVVRVELQSPLDNAWMYAQVALVEADGDTVVHVADEEFGYYHGYEGGESWSEGSRGADIYVQVEEAGSYRLMLGGVSGVGNFDSDRAQHSLSARVYRSARYTNAAALLAALGVFMVGGIAALLLLVIGNRARSRLGLYGGGGAVLGLGGALFATFFGGAVAMGAQGYGAPELEHPDGVSIRQSSVPGRPAAPFFFVYDSPRSHLGGGVHSGK